MLRRRSIVGGVALVVVVVAGVALWSAYARDRAYPHQYPGTHADVSLDRALSEHQVHLPEGASSLGYYAHRDAEGTVFRMDFTLPCPGVVSMMKDNGLRSVDDETKLSDAAVVVDARDRGWGRSKGDILAERPESRTASGLTALIARDQGRCHAYFNASH